MPNYVCLIQFTDQGIRNVKDTVKRGELDTPSLPEEDSKA